ncbi:MAG: AmmeMemoRadiSam system protein A [Sulfuricurvum sp.]|nr:AmmeMemoRadiSam system protein A [Sulfuricurvum sp.]
MEASLYPAIARGAIKAHFMGKRVDSSDLVSEYPTLNQPGATFVTLTKNGQLRGCIGSLVAHRPLIDDLISNAGSAAFRDPRFPPLSENEMESIRVEVSILTEPHKVEYTDPSALAQMIRPGIDGVILRLGNAQATFLPQVWDELREFDTFFAHLGMKAGIGSDPLSHHPEIYLYQVKKYKEG